MKLSHELRQKIIDSMQARRLRPIDLAKETGLQQSTIGRILSDQESMSDDTAAELSHALRISLPEMLVLSAGSKTKSAAVEDPAGPEYAADVWDDLARWARSDRASAKAKAAVLSTAELGGFTCVRLGAALSALSTASSPEDEDAERQPAVA